MIIVLTKIENLKKGDEVVFYNELFTVISDPILANDDIVEYYFVECKINTPAQPGILSGLLNDTTIFQGIPGRTFSVIKPNYPVS